MYVWVRLKPHTHTKCRLRFPPQYHISYKWGYYSAHLYKGGAKSRYTVYSSLLRIYFGLPCMDVFSRYFKMYCVYCC